MENSGPMPVEVTVGILLLTISAFFSQERSGTTCLEGGLLYHICSARCPAASMPAICIQHNGRRLQRCIMLLCLPASCRLCLGDPCFMGS